LNKLGSYFYGTILGIFLVAFFIKKIKGGFVFYAALLSQAIVLAVSQFSSISFLWFNVIGALMVVVIAMLLHEISPKKTPRLGGVEKED
jgi:solute:Na+ symporter, SSS family